MEEIIATTGRRKTSTSRVFLRLGSGEIVINKKKLEDYFKLEVMREEVLSPLVLTESQDRFDIKINVGGGGTTGQIGATKLAIARALVSHDESLKPILRKNGLMTRDSRAVERKKYGLKKARKRFQFSKR